MQYDMIHTMEAGLQTNLYLKRTHRNTELREYSTEHYLIKL